LPQQLVLVLALAGCGGGSSESASNGSIPVETVKRPTTTTTYRVPSSSMEPTLHCAQPGSGCEAYFADRVRAAGPARDPQRGDIIAFQAPPLAEEKCGAGGIFIKRLIALPGETWQEKKGFIYIDGKKLDEPYIQSDRRDTGTSYPLRQIPEGCSS
jgi:signal peptidase I